MGQYVFMRNSQLLKLLIVLNVINITQIVMIHISYVFKLIIFDTRSTKNYFYSY